MFDRILKRLWPLVMIIFSEDLGITKFLVVAVKEAFRILTVSWDWKESVPVNTMLRSGLRKTISEHLIWRQNQSALLW